MNSSRGVSGVRVRKVVTEVFEAVFERVPGRDVLVILKNTPIVIKSLVRVLKVKIQKKFKSIFLIT